MGSRVSQALLFQESCESIEFMHHFQQAELKKLFQRFTTLSHGKKYVSRYHVECIPEIVQMPYRQRVMQMFVDLKAPQTEVMMPISFASFVRILNYFTPKATEDEKIEFLFRLYDIDGDNYLSKDDLFETLKQNVGDSINPAKISMLVQGTITEVNQKKDGKISFEEFKQTIFKDPDFRTKLTIAL